MLDSMIQVVEAGHCRANAEEVRAFLCAFRAGFHAEMAARNMRVTEAH
jgi:hypothetical protein